MIVILRCSRPLILDVHLSFRNPFVFNQSRRFSRFKGSFFIQICLGLTCQRIETGFQPIGAAQRDKEDIAVHSVGLTAEHDVCRRHPQPLRVALLIGLDILSDPFGHFPAGFQIETGQRTEIGFERFQIHTRAVTQRVESTVDMRVGIFQHVKRHVAAVLFRERGEERTGIRIVMRRKEGIDNGRVAFGPCLTQRIFVAQTLCIAGNFLVGSARRQRVLGRRYDIQIDGTTLSDGMVKRHRHRFPIDHGQTEAVGF